MNVGKGWNRTSDTGIFRPLLYPPSCDSAGPVHADWISPRLRSSVRDPKLGFYFMKPIVERLLRYVQRHKAAAQAG